MERQEGYYWVKSNNEFQIAFWPNNKWKCWLLIYDLKGYKDNELQHINETRIKQPGELPD